MLSVHLNRSIATRALFAKTTVISTIQKNMEAKLDKINEKLEKLKKRKNNYRMRPNCASYSGAMANDGQYRARETSRSGLPDSATWK
jgi:hypothetical protein